MKNDTQTGRIFQINISPGGVPKIATPRAEVSEQGVTGDRQTNLQFHGGPDRALCLYSLERILQLQAEGHPTFPGAFGENIVISGFDWEKIQPGQCYQLGGQVLVEITRYTNPCNSLIPYFKDGQYGRISQAQYPGWSRVYARVLAGGTLLPGDIIMQVEC